MATAETKPHSSEFVNEPFIDFSRPENRKRMEEALKKVAAEFGREYPMYIGGQKGITAEKKTSTNPSHPSRAIGVFQSASVEQANQAVESAAKAFEIVEVSARRSSVYSACFAPHRFCANANLK